MSQKETIISRIVLIIAIIIFLILTIIPLIPSINKKMQQNKAINNSLTIISIYNEYQYQYNDGYIDTTFEEFYKLTSNNKITFKLYTNTEKQEFIIEFNKYTVLVNES